jgi:hypothetical protein
MPSGHGTGGVDLLHHLIRVGLRHLIGVSAGHGHSKRLTIAQIQIQKKKKKSQEKQQQ